MNPPNDDWLIRKAKRHAANSGKSVSKLVAGRFALIDTAEERSVSYILNRLAREHLKNKGMLQKD